jgi:hypothetical protein
VIVFQHGLQLTAKRWSRTVTVVELHLHERHPLVGRDFTNLLVVKGRPDLLEQIRSRKRR